MPAQFSGITLFCEDIRREESGQTTLVGIFLDNLQVAAAPFMLPKLGIFTRLSFLPDAEPIKISIILKQPDGGERLLTSFEADFIGKAMEEARSHGAPLAGVMAQAVASPFPVSGAGRYIVSARTENDEIILGIINFRIDASAPTASSLQPAQYPPGAS